MENPVDESADLPASYGMHCHSDADGIVVLIMDDPDQSVNTMNATWSTAYQQAVEWLEAHRNSITGVVLTSAKKSFFAGGDLHLLGQVDDRNAAATAAHVDHIKSLFRRMETLGVPVVAAINGAALGGGLEVALATHHRVVLDRPDVRLGVPEVTFGLLPGGGGITRLVRLLGLSTALTDWILPGTRHTPAAALAAGIAHRLVSAPEDLLPAAKDWIRAHPDVRQPWDVKGFRIPGGGADHPAVAAQLPAWTATLRRQLKGAPMPAPRAALAAAVEGSLVDPDTAGVIETRYLVSLLRGQVAKNMITTFFDLQKIEAGGSRPAGPPRFAARKVGVLGAGMMGAAIAYVCAKAGIQVVLKDVSAALAEQGKQYAARLEQRAVERGRTTAEVSAALLDRIEPTAEVADFAGVDLVIEAVHESVPVKQQVFREIEHIVEPDAVLGSNTSTLPITVLAEAVQQPADFIGIHFFSPVDKMRLVEIVRGRKTSDAVLAKVFDFVRQIRKTPIVVNDARGFFTSRVIGTFIDEGVAAVGEGVDPAVVEQAALQAGYPTGPLQLLDELTLTLPRKIRQETKSAAQAEGKSWVPHAAEAVIDTMIDAEGRTGRSGGAGFYDYDETGRRTRLWPGLRTRFGSGATVVSVEDLQQRMLFAEAIDAVRCLDAGVLTSVADANVGSLQGIGFPVWTGGVLQYINGYPGGPPGFVERARELAASYGPQFEPPASLVSLASTGGTYR